MVNSELAEAPALCIDPADPIMELVTEEVIAGREHFTEEVVVDRSLAPFVVHKKQKANKNDPCGS
jgi:hypothetical protein